jgi:hypothetical protein
MTIPFTYRVARINTVRQQKLTNDSRLFRFVAAANSLSDIAMPYGTCFQVVGVVSDRAAALEATTKNQCCSDRRAVNALQMLLRSDEKQTSLHHKTVHSTSLSPFWGRAGTHRSPSFR